MRAHLILYVRDQAASTAFYRRVLAREPELHVPGMTEFRIGADCMLGLMPLAGVTRLLGVDVGTGGDVAAAELYVQVSEPQTFHARALAAGARELSPFAARDWGDEAAYCRTPDGHVLAFARAFPPASSRQDAGGKGREVGLR